MRPYTVNAKVLHGSLANHVLFPVPDGVFHAFVPGQ